MFAKDDLFWIVIRLGVTLILRRNVDKSTRNDHTLNETTNKKLPDNCYSLYGLSFISALKASRHMENGNIHLGCRPFNFLFYDFFCPREKNIFQCEKWTNTYGRGELNGEKSYKKCLTQQNW